MKLNYVLFICSLLLIALISFSCVVANEDTNITEDSSVLKINDESDYDLNETVLSTNDEESLLSAQTIVVDESGGNHNEMNEHSIRNAISSASEGDTILIKGSDYVHVHLTIDKPITIKSEIGTNMDPCTSTAGSNYRGIFYLTSEASGTIIDGFNFNNDDGRMWDSGDYAIFINGASNIIIRNCTFSNNGVANSIRIENSHNIIVENVTASNAERAVSVKNSDGVTIRNSVLKDSSYGIYDENSAKTFITSNTISRNKNAGIGIAGSSKNPTISYNNLTENRNGFELASSDNINILSNYIASNSNFGVLVDCEVIQLNVIGNFFYKNSNGELYFNKKVLVPGGELLEVVNNNYMVGVGERPVDATVGGAFLGYAFILNENVYCPKIYFTYGEKHWEDGNYFLKLTDITQSKKGVYSISIVDPDGNVAKGLNSVPVTFYLNKNNNYAAPQEGDVYKTVMMVDGTATVRFYSEDFKESGNVVTAVLPGTSDFITGDQFKNVKNFTVDDKYIPGEVSPTRITMSDSTTYPGSNADYTITLRDIYNNPVANEEVTFNINSKNIKATTNANGQATVKINENAGTYVIKVNYPGDDSDYAPSSAQAKVTVNKVSSKIAASNYAMFIKKTDHYQFTLKDSNGKAISNQKVTVKVNKKTYTVKTNAKGVGKVKLKLKKGTYKIQLNYKGNSQFNAAKVTKKISVKKVLKTKLTAPKVTVKPKTSAKYVITLKDENGKVLKKQKIIIKVNGKKYTKKTNGKGQATVKVKFSKLKTYKVKVTYKGNKKYKKSSASGKIIVKKASAVVPTPAKPAEDTKVKTQLAAYNRSFSLNSTDDYIISLKDSSGQALANHVITYTLDGQSYSKSSDVNGQVKVNISSLGVGSHIINANHPITGNYEASSSTGTIYILNKTGVTYVDGGLPNEQMQNILDKSANPIVFLSDVYDDVSLTINKSLNITFKENATLNGKDSSPVLTIAVSNFNVSDLIINANSGSGIIIQNADNVCISNCAISNNLDSSKSDKYNSGVIEIPGNGIALSNANGVRIMKNDIKSFGNAIFVENSDDMEIANNTLSLSNYGITYGLGVKNTNISGNLITKNIGLYVMDVPEGPLGYGIFLNQSAVNVTITNNRILDNYMGISVDANYSTGIVILYNWISDNALEGIRFNAGYDLAENAVEPNVNDNAIYRNARGPSMMILGELSANPNGIYHYGEFNDTKRLQLGTNWYGKNARVTWNYETNTTGYGTMCPRIATTYISVKEIENVGSGTYQVKFYKNDTVADKLPEFEMFATLNDNVEIKFNVVKGVGTFSFDSGYNIGDNVIKVSIGSLKDQYRTFELLLNATIQISA